MSATSQMMMSNHYLNMMTNVRFDEVNSNGAEIVANVFLFLDKAKEFLKQDTGFSCNNLALAEVSESKDGDKSRDIL